MAKWYDEPDNPLANGNTDDDPNNYTFYGEDVNGPSPFQDSNNNVVVSPVELPNSNSRTLCNYLPNSIDRLRESSSFGIDIYADALEIAVQWLEHLPGLSTSS